MDNETGKPFGNPFKEFQLHLSGSGRLKSAYWRYGVVWTLILWFFLLLFSLMLLPAALRDHDSVLESPLFRGYLSGVYVFLAIYQVLVWVMVWRNARNVDQPLWGHLAKGVVAFQAAVFLYRAIA